VCRYSSILFACHLPPRGGKIGIAQGRTEKNFPTLFGAVDPNFFTCNTTCKKASLDVFRRT
jgi:hypothetical protein